MVLNATSLRACDVVAGLLHCVQCVVVLTAYCIL